MADQTLRERLQPSLLDRLTDSEPATRVETREERVIDIRRLREIIQRDLGWLLNTTNLEGEHDLELYDEVRASTLNYGVPDVSGKISSADRAIVIRQGIRRAIERFEPRILPGTLAVELHRKTDRAGAIISFDIRGELWAQPVPLELYLRTAFDVTTGEVSVSRQG